MQENPGAQVLATVLKDPGRPRITWYGPDDERVELSGAVLANWVNKTANLLLEEFDAGPGSSVRLDLPMHWRTVCWALAVWRVGGCVVLGSADADAIIGTSPHPGPVPYAVIALPALARRVTGPLPPGAVDAAASLAGYPDLLGPVSPVDPEQPALVAAGRQWTFTDLTGAASGDRRPLRVLLPTRTTPVHTALLRMSQVLSNDGSLVVVDLGDREPESHAGTPDVLDHLRAVERVDVIEVPATPPEAG
ncbi:MAG: TIGR03089 family protein [Cellulomonas sp.]|nr:TIGR03089 family protein [Cellulomonas sp.]